MKPVVLGVLFIAFCGSGCMNIGDVALIADYESLPGHRGGSYQLFADDRKSNGENMTLLSDAIKQYKSENTLRTYTYTVPVKISVQLEEPKKTLDMYEAFSGLLTFGTLGLWPTVMSDEIRCTLQMKNDTLDLSIPVLIRKRYMYGWLSCLPVPGWAEWRGKESDFQEGESKLLKKVIAENLMLSDYREYLINLMIRGKDVLLHESTQRQDQILRKFALRHAPEKWRNIQQIRAESALQQRKIARMYNELKELGYVPGRRDEFIQQCEKFFSAANRHRDAMIELEKLYLLHEYNKELSAPRNSETVTMEEILQGRNNKEVY